MKINRYLPGVAGPGKTKPVAVPAAQKQQKPSAFAGILQETLAGQELKFSAHAQQRLQERQIRLQTNDLEMINRALQRAEQKGARSTLMLYQDLALIASVVNKTIITAMKGDDMKEHVFTNIDSAVIIR
jgi:flagellar operon protein